MPGGDSFAEVRGTSSPKDFFLTELRSIALLRVKSRELRTHETSGARQNHCSGCIEDERQTDDDRSWINTGLRRWLELLLPEELRLTACG